MNVSVYSEYISVACNRIPEIADWNSEGIICFGAKNAVVLYNTKQIGGNPLTVRCHHRSQVNSVKWLQRPDRTTAEFVSCSADKTAAIWTLVDGNYEVTSRLEGHTEGVSCIAGLYVSGDDVEVYTGSIDCTVRIWKRKDGTTNLKQTINLNNGLCLTLHGHLLPQVCQPILFLALDDHKIHIYASTAVPNESGDNADYHKLHALAGHEDWVRGMDVLDVDPDTILLASASQDSYIRLWRLQRHSPHPALPAAPAQVHVEARLVRAHALDWSVELDAVLAAHEGWVYGVQWARGNKKGTSPLYRLLSSSLDKTLIIWEPAAGGAWAERVRVGGAGGSGLGYYGGRFGPGGDSFMGHGYNGSFHIWKLDKDTNQWSPSVVCGGHHSAVCDVRWERGGAFLASVSADQTTRVHALWRRSDTSSWHEIARPQVHGYDLCSLALVTPDTFASAAEEKVIRVFRAPHNFLQNYRNIAGRELQGAGAGHGPEGASVPSLGLSNKAVFTDDDTADDENDGYFVPVTLNEPPTEETLMQNTLWPEVQKLYGHGYEVYCLDASPDGTLLASACKATVADHAAVLIWETTNWQQIQKLVSHQLTVTQLAFSPDSQKLVSVSRDRRWTLYQRQQGGDSFGIAAATDKKNGVHSRIIWCCAWAEDSSVFGTGSREGKVCLWSKSRTATESPDSSLKGYALLGAPLELSAAVTALALAPRPAGAARERARLVAAGAEGGRVRLYSFTEAGGWSLLVDLDNSSAHHLTVRRLCFCPRSETRADGTQETRLASCGDDNLLRIYNVSISTS